MPSPTYSYDSSLAEDKDWVRLNIGDRGKFATAPTITGAVFSDEEIEATLALEANKWLAAASLGFALLAQKKGAVSKSVEDLSISYDHSPASAYRGHMQWLRERGCQELMKSSLGGSTIVSV